MTCCLGRGKVSRNRVGTAVRALYWEDGRVEVTGIRAVDVVECAKSGELNKASRSMNEKQYEENTCVAT